MWAHYANRHTGACIEFGQTVNNHNDVLLEQVKYLKQRPKIYLSQLTTLFGGKDLPMR